jgi:Ribonucleotide reductase inhibitor
MQQQQTLLNLGMRIRKSIQQGYKTVEIDGNGDLKQSRHPSSLNLQTKITDFYR